MAAGGTAGKNLHPAHPFNMLNRACSFKPGKAGCVSGCAVDRRPLSPISMAVEPHRRGLRRPLRLLADTCDWRLEAGWHSKYRQDSRTETHTHQHVRSLGFGRIDPPEATCARP